MRYEFADRNHAAWLDHVLHWSVVDNSVDAARHRAFIFARAVVAASILFGAPIWCFFYGMPSASQALLFLLAQAPLASIVVLARVGDLRLAQSVSIFGWLALAVAVHALTDGFETISIIFLTISLVEAALTPEIVMVFVIEAATMDVLALTAGRSFSEGTRSALAPTTTLAIIASPLLLYIALIAVSAIRTESARLRAEARNARDLRLLTDALGDIVLHLDRSGAVKSLVGDVHKTY
ncbi:MAG: PAS domain-containing sensor histidine kinase, partial [Methylocystis sp.]|nr:PAS domain-containing sensor histidine kinase [Methylocystis sp.]